MKKVFAIKDIDCANCAAKIEDRINKLKGVKEANLNFMMEKLSIEFESDNEENVAIVMDEVKKVVKKVEPDAFIVE